MITRRIITLFLTLALASTVLLGQTVIKFIRVQRLNCFNYYYQLLSSADSTFVIVYPPSDSEGPCSSGSFETRLDVPDGEYLYYFDDTLRLKYFIKNHVHDSDWVAYNNDGSTTISTYRNGMWVGDTTLLSQDITQIYDSLEKRCNCDTLKYTSGLYYSGNTLYSGTCYANKGYTERVVKNGIIRRSTTFFSPEGKKQTVIKYKKTGEFKKSRMYNEKGKIISRSKPYRKDKTKIKVINWDENGKRTVTVYKPTRTKE